jgi:hypothetical protein
LSGLVRSQFHADPPSGHLFVFFNRKADRLKILYWDRDAICVWYRRLERGRDQAREGHLWVYIGDRDHPYVVFDFTTHYRRDGPEQFLKGYAGYLQADALAQYEGLFTTGQVVHVACNAHARRRFVEAQASAPTKPRRR